MRLQYKIRRVQIDNGLKCHISVIKEIFNNKITFERRNITRLGTLFKRELV